MYIRRGGKYIFKKYLILSRARLSKSSIYYSSLDIKKEEHILLNALLFYLYQKLYFLFGFFGNQPFFTRSSCSNISLMVQKEEKEKTPIKEEIIRLSTQRVAAMPAIPKTRNIHQHFVPQ